MLLIGFIHAPSAGVLGYKSDNKFYLQARLNQE